MLLIAWTCRTAIKGRWCRYSHQESPIQLRQNLIVSFGMLARKIMTQAPTQTECVVYFDSSWDHLSGEPLGLTRVMRYVFPDH